VVNCAGEAFMNSPDARAMASMGSKAKVFVYSVDPHTGESNSPYLHSSID
jgi:hypothetical protein